MQVAAVEQSLAALGHAAVRLACTLNLECLRNQIFDAKSDLVFNLVEALAGSDRLMPLVPMLLETMRIPYTGTSSLGIARTSDKLAAKREMRLAGLPTPIDFCPSVAISLREMKRRAPPPKNLPTSPDQTNEHKNAITGRYLIKAIGEHASVGMDDTSLISPQSAAELQAACEAWSLRTGHACFAEAFLEGREFNLSLLDSPQGPQLLPPAEIDFSTFPMGLPRMVGYRAKWVEASFEYQNTPRRFDFAATDRPLLDQLCDLAERCWQLFDLRGYARVDFRVDENGNPWILEVNANPCFSPDAGFAAAVERAGIRYDEAIERVLQTTGCGESPDPALLRDLLQSAMETFECGVRRPVTNGNSP